MSRFAKYLPVLGILGAVSIVGAQTAPVTGAAAGGGSTPTTTPPSAAKLSAAEMSASLPSYETQIQDDGRQIMHLREVANKQKDIIKTTCLNDKLIQYKAQLNIWDTNKATFEVSISKSDADRVSAYTSLTDVAKSVHTLRDEANACVGEPELYKQEAGVEVHHPPFPDDPTADDPFTPTAGDIEPPGYASPFY